MSYFDVRKKSPIEAFRNFIPCGVHSCKYSCVENSIVCEICLKHYHFKCRNLSKRKYLRITEKKCSYICSKECYSSIFPFWNIDDIDFHNTLNDDAMNPCKKCKRNCIFKTVKARKKIIDGRRVTLTYLEKSLSKANLMKCFPWFQEFISYPSNPNSLKQLSMIN